MVRRLLYMTFGVVVDLSGSMEGSALLYYNKVSTDFASCKKALLTNIIKTL